ncbi:MAG: hypothetical protein [Bacteriophage sp.]|nr:MAG: hypothetical protein [Bacteriophage sp.]
MKLIHFETEFNLALYALMNNQPYTSETGYMQLDNKDFMSESDVKLSVGNNRIYIEDNCIKWYCNIYMNKIFTLVDMNGDCPVIHTTRYTDLHGVVYKHVDTIMNRLLKRGVINSYAYSSFQKEDN